MILKSDPLIEGSKPLSTDRLEPFLAYAASAEGPPQRHNSSVGTELGIEVRRASLGRIGVSLIYNSVSMAVESARQGFGPYRIYFPLSAAANLEIDGNVFSAPRGAGFVTSPSQRVRRTGPPGWALVLGVPGDLLRARLKARSGCVINGPLVFRCLISAKTPEIRNYCLLIVEAIDRGAADCGTPLAEVLESGLADLLLDLQPHTHGETLASREAARQSDRVRVVTSYIDRHLHNKLGVNRLAQVAGCSVRSLQTAFLEHFGISPMEYLRQSRLAAARELLESAGANSKVSEIAHRTGFSQLARFAANYREIYGESPSETLRRAARQTIRNRQPALRDEQRSSAELGAGRGHRA